MGGDRPSLTLADLWHALKTERHFRYEFWLDALLHILSRSFMRHLSRLLVVLVFVLLSTIGFFGFYTALPAVARDKRSLWFAFNVVWGVVLLYGIFFNYVMALTTDPSLPPTGSQPDCEVGGAVSSAAVSSSENRFCKPCNGPKPSRTHHCSACKRCIPKMDHHCPWLNNCVGLYNYRYFCGFLLWTTMGTLYVCAALAPIVLLDSSIRQTFRTHWAATKPPAPPTPPPVGAYAYTKELFAYLTTPSALRRGSGWLRTRPRRLTGVASRRRLSLVSPVAVMVNLRRMQRIIDATPTSDSILMLLFGLCGALGLGVGALFSLHAHLLLTGQTTLEFYGRLGRTGVQWQANPHDKGALRNFQEVFGSRPWYIALLPQIDDVTRKLRRS